MKKIDPARLLATRGLATAAIKPRLDPGKLVATKGLAVMPGKPAEEF